MLPIIVLNSCAGIILSAGVYALHKIHHVDEWHHLWFTLLAFALTNGASEWWRLIPLLIGLDDAIQHTIQWKMNNFNYQSPLHWLYAKVYTWWFSKG